MPDQESPPLSRQRSRGERRSAGAQKEGRTRIVAVSMEDICAEVVKAAAGVLKAHGLDRPSVVVNFAWKDPGDPQTYAVGTAIPKRHRAMLRDSLAQSTEEAE